MSKGLAGTLELVRLALRRDRVMLPLWVTLFVVMAAFSADATMGLYPDTASRVQAAEAINGTPSLVAMYGRIYDVTSLGAIAMIKMGGIGAAMLAVVAFMLVIRHTRADEEGGRLELVAGGVVGTYAPLAAALLSAAGAAVAIGVLTGASLTAVGLPASGSFAFGLAWTATGVVFAAVGALAAQVTANARAARGLATLALGVAYVLRAVGDTSGAEGPSWLTWSSPIGWGQQVRPYAGDRWAVFAILLVFAGAASALAFVLNRRRDLDAGLLPDRPGRGTGARGLRSPLGLAWRLHRASLAAWTAGFVALGFILGNIASNVGDILTSPQAREMITKLGGVESLTDAFVSAELGFVAIFASAFGIAVALRMHAEETGLRLESILATAARRTGWAASHIVIALAGTTALMTAAGLSVGLSQAAQTGEPGKVGGTLAAALVQLPAVWLLVGVVVALFGVVPRLSSAAWAVLVAALLIAELGRLLQLPDLVVDLSPYTHVPLLPADDVRVMPLFLLTALTASFVALGLAAFRRRDVGTV